LLGDWQTTAARSAATSATMASANSIGLLSAFGTVTVRVTKRDPPAMEARDDDVTIHLYPAAPNDRTAARAARCSPSVTITVRRVT